MSVLLFQSDLMMKRLLVIVYILRLFYAFFFTCMPMFAFYTLQMDPK